MPGIAAWKGLIHQLIDGQYLLEALTDCGSDQAEFVGRHEGRRITVTLIAPPPESFEEVRSQLRAAERLQHGNLLRVIRTGQWVVPGMDLLYLAAESPDQTLADLLRAGPLPQTSARELLAEVGAGLEYLRRNGLAYRGLDPHTVVRAGSQWKLADYGCIEPIATPEDDRPLSAEEIAVRLKCSTAKPVAPPPPQREPVISAPVAAVAAPAQSAARPPLDWSRLASVMTLVLVAALFTVWWRGSAPHAEPAKAPQRAETVTPAPKAVQPAPLRPSPMPAKPAEDGSQARALPEQTKPAPATTPAESDAAGLADYSSSQMDGRVTASGERFDSNSLTAAHPTYRLGTRLRVTNLGNGRSVIVRVNDRGVLRRGYAIRLTERAARDLGFAGRGSAQVKLEVVP
jgi:rare lipoprotein A